MTKFIGIHNIAEIQKETFLRKFFCRYTCTDANQHSKNSRVHNASENVQGMTKVIDIHNIAEIQKENFLRNFFCRYTCTDENQHSKNSRVHNANENVQIL